MAKIEEYSKMDDSDIVTVLESNIKTSVGYYDSELSKERKKVTEYYNATLPRPAHDGNSKFVSQDVYDSVEALKAALLETFASGNNIVKFAPQNADDVETAEVCSKYTDYVMFRQNDAFSVMNSAIHDGLTARVGIAKVFWDEREEVVEEEFSDLNQDELDMLLAQDNVELGESETNEVGLITGTILTARDTSQVSIESIAPEEFLIEPQAKSLDEVNFVAHRTRKTLTELREMGYSEELLDNIGSDHDDVEIETDPEVLARFESIGASRGSDSKGYQDQVRDIMVYECYVMLDKEGTGIAYLYKVCKAGNVILECTEVDRKPFIVFTPLPIPHAFFGSNFASKVISTQNARTILTRSILDHAVITNNPRYMVVKGGLTNPRELIDNRVGGLVNVSRPDAISPMPQAPLNPFIFQTLQVLSEENENTTGVSKLSQGLNKDAISKQNSAAMVEQLATMSQQRQKIIARNFANQFLKPLFHEVYKLVVENEQYEKVVDIAGNFVEIDPTDWKEKRDVMVELKLGYGEQERDAAKFMQLHSLFSQDPNLQPMYQLPNRFAMMKEALQKQGILNVEEFLTPPDQLPQPQPDPMQEMQTQMAQKQLELQERQQQLAEMKVQMDAQMNQMKLELDKMKAESSHALSSDNQDLKEEQFAHKKYIDEAELEVLSQAEDVRGIASPTG
tara:strand:- start:715 stop:2751 length:2037 start_codon:yes stop_codon:yes gene_type:complete